MSWLENKALKLLIFFFNTIEAKLMNTVVALILI